MNERANEYRETDEIIREAINNNYELISKATEHANNLDRDVAMKKYPKFDLFIKHTILFI